MTTAVLPEATLESIVAGAEAGRYSVRDAQLALLAARTDGTMQFSAVDQALETRLRGILNPVVRNGRTRRLYAADLRVVARRLLAAKRWRLPLAHEVVIEFLDGQVEGREGLALADRRAAAIGALHRAVGLANPCVSDRVREARVAIRQKWGWGAWRHGRLGPDILGHMVSAIQDDDLCAYRDRALLLVGFVGYMTPSDIIALEVEGTTVSTGPHGRILTIRKRTGEVRLRAEEAGSRYPSLCPVAAYEEWLTVSKLSKLRRGRVFCNVVDTRGSGSGALGAALTMQGLRFIVKRRASAIGLPAAQFSTTSLRQGFLSAAAAWKVGPFASGPDSMVSVSAIFGAT
jgi:hypothetical protein